MGPALRSIPLVLALLAAPGLVASLRPGVVPGVVPIGAGWGAARAQDGPAVVVVDLRKVLENSAAGRRLETAERAARAVVQEELDRVKQELEAEERTLTEQRESMPPAEFARLGAAFDLKVREERRAAQERGAHLLKFLEDGREALRLRLPDALEALRRRTGASAVLDAAAVAAWDPDLDATAEAAALFDQMTADMTFDAPPELLEP